MQNNEIDSLITNFCNINDNICNKYDINIRKKMVSSLQNYNCIEDFINKTFEKFPKYRIFLAKKNKSNCCCQYTCCSDYKIKKKNL